MFTDISHVMIVVDDQDEALDYYTETLGFELRDDIPYDDDGNDMRWVTVAPSDSERQFVLGEADTEDKQACVGSQVGDGVVAVVQTDDCVATYEQLTERGVTFHGEPVEEQWGISAVFEDLYGNVFNMIGPSPDAE